MDSRVTNAKTGYGNDAFVVRRRIRLDRVRGSDEVARIRDSLLSLTGMLDVNVDTGRARLDLRYDAAILGFGDIERTLDALGCARRNGIWSRMRAALYRYMDDNAHENAGHRAAPCCSSPGEIYVRKHK